MSCRAARGTLAAALLVGLALAAHAEDGAPIRFVWALLQRTDDGTAQALDCTRETIPLQSGDRIRIWMKPLTDCWAYLYLHDAQGRLTPLDPASAEDTTARTAGNGRFVPDAQAWFRLDAQPGTEVLYLVLSDRRLSALEDATRSGRDGPTAVGSYRPLDRPSAALQEIRRLVVRSSGLLRPAEKPVPVAGDFRGLQAESGFDGLMIEAQGLYVRTFRLQH